MEPASRHQCLVYEGPPSRHLPALAQIMHQKLSENYRCLYLNSEPMVAGMRSYLAAAGVDVELAMKRDSLLLSSDQSHVFEGVFDADGMIEALEHSVRKALKDGHTGLFATGDMTWEMGPDRDLDKLSLYEHKLERLFRKYPELNGICQYHADTLPREAVREGLVSHRTIFVNQTLSMLNPYHLPPRVARELIGTKHAEPDTFLMRMLAETSR